MAQHAQGSDKEAKASFEMAPQYVPNSTLLFSEVARMHLKAAASKKPTGISTPPLNEPTFRINGPRPDFAADRPAERGGRPQNPNHADTALHRPGLLHRNRGQIEDAINSFRKARRRSTRRT